MIEFSLQKNLHAANGEMLFDVTHIIKPGSFVGLHGASGSGKTSLLRMLAGFLKPANGFIKFDNVDWFNSEKHIDLTPQKRKIGFVFQDYALFPNMTVKQNLSFALDKNTPQAIVDELLNLVELDQLGNRKIQTLSGGQKQRVALARALVRKPDLLLLDEPLSALDAELRERLQLLIYKLHKQFGLTTILVSHDIAETIRLADEILFIKDGVIEKSGSPVEMFYNNNQTNNTTVNAVVVEVTQDELCLLIGKELIKIKPINIDISKIKKGDALRISLNEQSSIINIS